MILKLVNTADKEQAYEALLEGIKKLPKQASVTVLKSADLNTINTINTPVAVVPQQSMMEVKGKKIALNLAPYSFTVLRVKM